MQLIKRLLNFELRHVLTIGGLDPTTGAGVYADIKTLSMIKTLPLAVTSCLIIENTQGVKEIVPLEPNHVENQLKCVLDDCTPDAVKVSLIYNEEIASIIADLLPKNTRLVLDPILKSWDGHDLITPSGLKALKDLLIPRASILTPNAMEAETLSGIKVKDLDSAREAAKRLRDMGAKCVIIKGGHIPSNDYSIDLLYYEDEVHVAKKPRIKDRVFHGLGCVLTSALTGFLSHNLNVKEAFELASLFVEYAMKSSYNLRGKATLVNPLELYYKSLDVVHVLENMYEAIALIESIKGMEEITPEVGVNIAMCLRSPMTLDDICGIEGRLRPIRGYLRAQGLIKFGGSKHLGNMLLEVNRRWPSIRACANIKYSNEIVEIMKSLGFTIASFDRSKEPQHIKSIEGMSMKWGAQEAIRNLISKPDAVYDLGDVGKEPMIRIFGKDAIEVVEKLRLISLKLKELKKTSGSKNSS